MPKLGMEPIRRAALVKATIEEIGRAGTLDITVSQIAKRAGMSSALAHHYFGGKDQIFLAAMRHTLAVYAAQVRDALAGADAPGDRLRAIVHASFGGQNFLPEVIAAWMNFYVLAQISPDAMRLLRVYHKRLISNLVHALRPLVGARAPEVAENVAALIDGVYLRKSLGEGPPDSENAVVQVERYLRMELAQATSAACVETD